MAQFKSAWLEHQQRRAMRPGAHLYIRPDAHRFMPSGAPRWSGKDVVRSFWPAPDHRKDAPHNPRTLPWTGKRGRWMPNDSLAASRRERRAPQARANLIELKWQIAVLRFVLALCKYHRALQEARERALRASLKAGFRPDRPRWPAGARPFGARGLALSRIVRMTIMPLPASVALRAAIYDALVADGALAALLGGPKVYDQPPRGASFPYVTLGEARLRDFSAGETRGAEHQLTLHAWSRQGGHREAHMIAGALLQALDDAPLALADHRLVNLRFAHADVRREADGRTYHALVRFRAVTEPAS